MGHKLNYHIGPKINRVRKEIYWRNNVAPIETGKLFLTHTWSTTDSNFSQRESWDNNTERITNRTFNGIHLWQEYVRPEWVFSCNDIWVHLQCHIKARLASFLLVTVKWARDWAMALSKEKLNSNLYGSKQVIAVFIFINASLVRADTRPAIRYFHVMAHGSFSVAIKS